MGLKENNFSYVLDNSKDKFKKDCMEQIFL